MIFIFYHSDTFVLLLSSVVNYSLFAFLFLILGILSVFDPFLLIIIEWIGFSLQEINWQEIYGGVWKRMTVREGARVAFQPSWLF